MDVVFHDNSFISVECASGQADVVQVIPRFANLVAASFANNAVAL